MTRGFKRVITETATISEMATELAASIVAAASTLHEQHTERKILRVICPVPLTVRGTQTLVSFAPLKIVSQID